MSAEQLSLNFDFRPSLEEGDFLVDACNEQAVKWLDRWPDWPSPFLLIQGPHACGKTHLAEIFKKATNGKDVFLTEDPYEALDQTRVGILEDLAQVTTDLETQLFHLYNSARENKRSILITSRKPYQEWGLSLADLKSRMATVPCIEISQPDDVFLRALTAKLLSDRQLYVAQDVIEYLLSRIERSFEAVYKSVEQIDAHALKTQRKITVPLVREVLQR